MPGLNAGLFIGLSGLQAQQSALNVVGHNIANVNTPGYSRQRADLSSNLSTVEGQVYFGTGVSLNTVQGIRDRFLDLQIYRETARQTGANERFSGVDAVSSSIGDTGETGIGAQVQAFFQSFQELATKPEDMALRQNVVGKAQTMISGLQTRYRLLKDQRSSADQAVTSLLGEVNALTSQIAKLNQQIATEGSTGSANDAWDQRKTLTDRLAGLVGINVTESAKGEYQITLDTGAAVLVSSNTSYALQKGAIDPASGYAKVVSSMGNLLVDVTQSIREGQLGAKLDLRDNILVGFQRQLDQLAAGVAGEVNKAHKAGFVLDAVTAGGDFFVASGTNSNGGGNLPAAISAGSFYRGMVESLSVNSAVTSDLSLIAAAGVTGAKGDNTAANNIANLQSQIGTVDTNGDGNAESGPFSTVIGSLVNDVGTQSMTYRAQSDTQQNLVVALQNQRDRISGVDLDEEATSMMTLQRGYQASARFLSVINQLTDQLVNQFGR